MDKKLNILSIDWDYFIKADMVTRSMLFPDCPNENFPAALQNIIWVSRYTGNSQLAEIGLNESAIEEIRKLFSSRYFQPISVVAADSHRHCYDFVKQLYDIGQFNGINLMNVDFHHDMYQNSEDVDCGNWLYKLTEEFPDENYMWIHHLDSDLEMPEHKASITLNSHIEHIHSYVWDAVFICRSGMWSPPHLDSDFTDLFQSVVLKFSSSYEPAVFESRYNATFITEVNRENVMRQVLPKNISF